MKYNRLKILPSLAYLVIVVGFHLSARSQIGSCALEIPTSESYIDGHGNASGIHPSDTICLLSGTRNFLWIRYLHGTPEAPIVIMNSLGGVNITGFYYGVKIDSCSYLKFSGKGVAYIDYGIKIHDINGGGLSIESLSTDIELEGIEITGTVFVGIFAKTDPDCSFNSTRDKYIMRNISIHDNYIHHTGMEGMYIGSSFYTGYTINCEGKDTLLYPHVLRGVNIFRNRVEYTGWDGIQVSSSDSGCSIYGNYVAYDSDSSVYNQMSGIIIGGGSKCDCFNNTITDGKGVGINVFGLGDEKIYNNLIVRAGQTFPDPYPLISAIYTGDVVTIPGSGFLFTYNTIICPKVFGIHFKNTGSTGNLAANNIVLGPGVDFFDGENLDTLNNLIVADCVADQFVDPVHGNFDLKPSSPAVNAAVPLSQLNLAFDILDRSRPFARISDIGAFESHDSSLLAVNSHPDPDFIRLQIRQIQGPGIVMVSYSLPVRSSVQLCFHTITGEKIGEILFNDMSAGDHQYFYDLSEYKPAIYICTIRIGYERYSKKFSLIR